MVIADVRRNAALMERGADLDFLNMLVLMLPLCSSSFKQEHTLGLQKGDVPGVECASIWGRGVNAS